MKRLAKLFTVRLVYANEEKGSKDGGWHLRLPLSRDARVLMMRRLSPVMCIGGAGNAPQERGTHGLWGPGTGNEMRETLADGEYAKFLLLELPVRLALTPMQRTQP